MDKACTRPIPAALLEFDATEWKARDETAALNRWREARSAWADNHGWHASEDARLLQEKHTAARVLERHLAACVDPEEAAAAFRAYLDEHVTGLRTRREASWRAR